MRQRTKNFRQQADFERRRADILFFLVFSIAILYTIIHLVFGERGLIKYYELKRVEKTIQAEIESLRKGNDQLRSQIEALSRDSFLKEKYARENFGLAKPDEYIYLFRDENERK